MGVATGTVDTEAILAAEKRIDMVNEFQELDPDETQFYSLLSKAPSRPAKNNRIAWLESQYLPNRSTVAGGGYASGATAVTVATGTGVYFRDGDLVKNMTAGDTFEVNTGGVSGDVLTVTRGIGGVAAAAGTAGDELMIVSNASAQGANVGVKKIMTRVEGFVKELLLYH